MSGPSRGVNAPIHYRVDLSGHRQHLVHVRFAVPAELAADGGTLSLPVWTPGSYVVRNYVHHVQSITARTGGKDAPLAPSGTSSWRVTAEKPDGPVEVTLELYAYEASVRTNHVDDRHALIVPAATFPLIEGADDRPHTVEVAAPEGWRVWSLLPHDRAGAFAAEDYDHLMDSAFAAGRHEEVGYQVGGVPHRFVWGGHTGKPDLARIAEDARSIGEQAVALWDGDLPVDRYTFVCLSLDRGGGGLEHRDGAVLMVPAHAFSDPERSRQFQALLTHEYLHLWNVKRLIPRELTRLDYQRPVHTHSLWVAEGWTAYYEHLLPARAGLWSPETFLQRLSKTLTAVLRRPGARRQSVRQASHEAWTKHYVRDENTPNAGVSYYAHGAVLALCLDLLIRRLRPDSDGLDDVVRLLWRRFGDRTPREAKGYSEEDVEAAVSEVAGSDLSGFFADHVDSPRPPPVGDLLTVVGLELVDEEDPAPPDLGVEVSESDRGVTITAVLRDRPAWRGGLSGGDELLAIDGVRVRRGDLEAALRAHEPGEEVEVAVFRGARLVVVPVTLGDPRPSRRLVASDDASAAQHAIFSSWSGLPLPVGSQAAGSQAAGA